MHGCSKSTQRTSTAGFAGWGALVACSKDLEGINIVDQLLDREDHTANGVASKEGKYQHSVEENHWGPSPFVKRPAKTARFGPKKMGHFRPKK